MITLAAFDELSRNRAVELLKECCGSSQWAARMEKGRPFASVEALLSKSDEIWWTLRKDDWIEAFKAHPRLGDASVKPVTTSAAWSQAEQARIVGQKDALDDLARLNLAYEERFGWIFILCASGKSAAEAQESIRRRMNNEHAVELREAAEEQNKITRLRLLRLFEPATISPLKQE